MRIWKAALLVAAILIVCSIWIISAEGADLPRIDLNASAAGPREVEETTGKAIVRDYARAWASMTAALSNNRPELLDADFVGVALDNLRERVQQQQQSRLHTRYVDRGHSLQAVFYSLEGSAIQLHDTAQLEVQYLDGDRVIHSEQRTENYTVVLTPGENRWKVRVLQEGVGK